IRIRSFFRFSKINYPPYLKSALPHINIFIRSTKIDFAENQLSLSLISLSPLTTNHPNILQHIRVRSSKWCYHLLFNLFIVRSLSFGSYYFNLNAFSDSLLLRQHYILLKLAKLINSLAYYTKGKPSHISAPTVCKQ